MPEKKLCRCGRPVPKDRLSLFCSDDCEQSDYPDKLAPNERYFDPSRIFPFTPSVDDPCSNL